MKENLKRGNIAVSEDVSVTISEQLKAHKGKWVSLNENETEILGVADNVRSAVDQAHEKGETNPLLIKVPISEVRSYFF